MVALIRLLLPLLGKSQLLLLPRLLRCPLAVPEFLQSIFALLPQIREFLNFGLIETIDDGVFAVLDVDALDLGM